MTSNERINYGINTCFDLYDKLKHEGANLENNWNAYNSFNFIITAWHLHNDWLHSDKINRPKLATKKKNPPKTPEAMMSVVNALRDLTNGSKHFHLNKKSENKKVVTKTYSPIIGDWAAYFLHGPMIYVEIDRSTYSMWDLRHIVLLYFNWVFDDTIPANQFPIEIKKHLERCVIKD